MQKRFCTCGHMVLVKYLCNGGTWKPLVIVDRRAAPRQRNTLSTCPGCGSPLNIHSLR